MKTAKQYWEEKEKDFIKTMGLELMINEKVYFPNEVWEFMEGFAAQQVLEVIKDINKCTKELKIKQR